MTTKNNSIILILLALAAAVGLYLYFNRGSGAGAGSASSAGGPGGSAAGPGAGGPAGSGAAGPSAGAGSAAGPVPPPVVIPDNTSGNLDIPGNRRITSQADLWLTLPGGVVATAVNTGKDTPVDKYSSGHQVGFSNLQGLTTDQVRAALIQDTTGSADGADPQAWWNNPNFTGHDTPAPAPVVTPPTPAAVSTSSNSAAAAAAANAAYNSGPTYSYVHSTDTSGNPVPQNVQNAGNQMLNTAHDALARVGIYV